MAKVKAPNNALDEFLTKARNQGMTYRQLQVQETLERQKAEKEAAERLARRKGGGTSGCEKLSSASQ